ncbi:MAG: GNAT family N-acetyltransferase [Oscillospiraceae bacterium]
MNTDGLYRLREKDADKLCSLLAECFLQDPLYCELIPDESKRKKMLPEIFDCEIEDLFQNCEIFADSADINGIIIVSDESEPYNPFVYNLKEAFCALKTGACLIKDDLSLKTLWNFVRGQGYLSEAWTDDICTDDRLHIIYLAVRPSKQGNGIAAKLLREVIAYADQKRMLTSLETHNVHNVDMYKHFGFNVFEVLQKHFALKQYCMVR